MTYTTCYNCNETHDCDRYEIERNGTHAVVWLCDACVFYLEDEGVDVTLEP